MEPMNNGSIICKPAATIANRNTAAIPKRCGQSQRMSARRYSRRLPRGWRSWGPLLVGGQGEDGSPAAAHRLWMARGGGRLEGNYYYSFLWPYHLQHWSDRRLKSESVKPDLTTWLGTRNDQCWWWPPIHQRRRTAWQRFSYTASMVLSRQQLVGLVRADGQKQRPGAVAAGRQRQILPVGLPRHPVFPGL